MASQLLAGRTAPLFHYLSQRNTDGTADIPKNVLYPAAAATAAYINAKYAVTGDLWNVQLMVRFQIWMKRLEKQDRMNLFYLLEQWAKDPQTENRAFIVTPGDPANGVPQTETTYKEAYEKVLKCAAWLKSEHGVVKGEMVAMDYMNRPQFV